MARVLDDPQTELVNAYQDHSVVRHGHKYQSEQRWKAGYRSVPFHARELSSSQHFCTVQRSVLGSKGNGGYLQRSYPAASREPRAGSLAFSESLLTRSWNEGGFCAESDNLRLFSGRCMLTVI